MMDRQEDYQREDAKSSAIIAVGNHGGQSGILMIKETIEAKHEGALHSNSSYMLLDLSGMPKLGREQMVQHFRP